MILHNHSDSLSSSQLAVSLKVLSLLIAATFNTELLQILQSMIEISITPSMYLWSGRDAMQRITVRISVSLSTQYLKFVKVVLKDLLSSNLDKKIIIYMKSATIFTSDINNARELVDNCKFYP